jgi:hypothetical protein
VGERSSVEGKLTEEDIEKRLSDEDVDILDMGGCPMVMFWRHNEMPFRGKFRSQWHVSQSFEKEAEPECHLCLLHSGYQRSLSF